MYIVIGRTDTHLTIKDTMDGVEENISKDDAYQLLQSGVRIWGASSFSIEHNTPLTVILRLQGSDPSDIRDFDGWLFSDSDTQRSPYYSQILDLYTEADLQNYDTFTYVCSLLRSINNCPYNFDHLSSPASMSYSVYAGNTQNLTLKDSKGSLYACDYYTCLYCYLVENDGIAGLNYITDTELSWGSYVLKGSDVLKKYWESNVSKLSIMSQKERDVHATLLTKEVSVNFVEDLYCDYSDLAMTFLNSSYKVLSDSFIPLYSLQAMLRDGTKINRYHLPVFEEFGTVVSVNANEVVFDDGRVLDDWDYILTIYKVLNCATPEVHSLLKKYAEGKLALAKLADDKLFNRLNSLSLMSRHVKTGEYNIWTMRELEINGGIRELTMKIDDFGMLAVRSNGRILESTSNVYDKILIASYTNSPTCWYSFDSFEPKFGTQKEFKYGYSGISGKVFDKVYEYAVQHGLTYFDDSILPLCVHSVEISEQGINILIGCLVIGNHEKYGKLSRHFITMPLVFFGGKCIDYDSYIEIKLLGESLYLDKRLLGNLYGVGTYDVIALDSFAGKMNLKNNREVLEYMTKAMTTVFKEIVD